MMSKLKTAIQAFINYLRRDEKLRAKLKAEWGKPKETYFSFGLIEKYFSSKPSDPGPYTLGERAVDDLDFHAFFSFVDRTNSAIGQQYLYYRLRHLNQPKAELEKLEEQINYYVQDEERRINIQQLLLKVSTTKDYYFPDILYGSLPAKLRYLWLIRLLQILFFAGLLASLIHKMFFIPLLLVFAINVFLHYQHKNRIGNFAIIFGRLRYLTQLSRKLLKYTPKSAEEQEEGLKKIKKIEKITTKIDFLKTDRLQETEVTAIAWYVLELIKVVTLSEIITFDAILDDLKTSRKEIEHLFVFVAEMDMAISIASLRAGLPFYTQPNFVDAQKEIQFVSLYHPLVKACVENDLHLKGRSLLLTGSNMSGKSTFIKAINLNVIAAQTLNTSFSKLCKIPPLAIATSIKIEDSLLEDKSYYMEEVNAIGRLIELSDNQDSQVLFTIDEVFKGTNTIERVSAAKAILTYLSKGKHIVLVSTHDIELTQLLAGGYDLYYFQERIENQSLSFDYTLRQGALKKKNAIHILEIAGYPTEIIAEAKDLAAKFEQEKIKPIL
ncbi:MAG: hypothetical protein R2828_02700 [Saprospiraceae bacterium]